MWQLSHLYFSHHIVVGFHVHSEGLSHLSLTVVQDLDLHKVLLLAFLELHVLDTDVKVCSHVRRRLAGYLVTVQPLQTRFLPSDIGL